MTYDTERSVGDLSRFSVLVVCRANVCRSPTAAILLRRFVRAGSMSNLVDVTSAGVSVVAGLPWCRVAAAQVSAGPDRAALLGAHRATAVTVDQVERADLVLTAAREQRAAIARLVPTARVRAFTLQEAAVLANAVALRMGHRLVPLGSTALSPADDPAWESDLALSAFPEGAAPETRLRWLTAEMHNARGLVPLLTPSEGSADPRRRWWPRRRPDPADAFERTQLDIPDPHGPGGAPHNADQLRAAVETWATVAMLAVEGVAELES